MKHWYTFLRPEHGLWHWFIVTSAGNLICRSLMGFETRLECEKHLSAYHPKDHF